MTILHVRHSIKDTISLAIRKACIAGYFPRVQYSAGELPGHGYSFLLFEWQEISRLYQFSLHEWIKRVHDAELGLYTRKRSEKFMDELQAFAFLPPIVSKDLKLGQEILLAPIADMSKEKREMKIDALGLDGGNIVEGMCVGPEPYCREHGSWYIWETELAKDEHGFWRPFSANKEELGWKDNILRRLPILLG